MKKIEFTIEVIILLGVIPFYVLLEMTHTQKQIPETIYRSIEVKQAEQDMITGTPFKNYLLNPAS